MTDDNYEDGYDELRAPDEWREGDAITILHAQNIGWGADVMGSTRSCARGDVLVVDKATLRDRARFLAFVADEQQQRDRWGEIRILRGRHEIERWHKPGDAAWIIARDAARQVASQTVDPVERAERYAEIQRRFGAAPVQNAAHKYTDLAQQRREADDLLRRAQQPREINVSTAN